MLVDVLASCMAVSWENASDVTFEVLSVVAGICGLIIAAFRSRSLFFLALSVYALGVGLAHYSNRAD